MVRRKRKHFAHQVAYRAAVVGVGVAHVEQCLRLVVAGLERRKAFRIGDVVGVYVNRCAWGEVRHFFRRNVNRRWMEGVLVDLLGTAAGRQEDERTAGCWRGELLPQRDAEEKMLRLLRHATGRTQDHRKKGEKRSGNSHGESV